MNNYFLIIFTIFIGFSISVKANDYSQCEGVELLDSFAFHEGNIQSWYMHEAGLSITLTEAGKREQFQFTKKNVGKKSGLYIESLCLGTPKITEPIGGGTNFLVIEPKIQHEVIKLLPEQKEEKK